MSIEKPEGTGSSGPKPDSSEEDNDVKRTEEKDIIRKKLLQDALQESYELDLSNLQDKLGESIRNIEKNCQEAGAFNKSREGINLDTGAFQKAYDARLKKGETYYAKEVADLAKKKGLKLDPNTESLQSGYEILLEEGDGAAAEKIDQLAQKNGIELTVNKDAIQKGYDYVVENFYSYKLEEIKQFAKEKGIELEVKKECLQKAYDNALSESNFLNELEEIEQFASKNGISLELDKELAKESYTKFLLEGKGMAYGDAESVVKEWLDKRNQFVGFLTKRGVEINIENERIQVLYEESIKKADDRLILLAQKLASEKGINLVADNVNFQEFYDGFISKGVIEKEKIINKIAQENGFKIKDPSKEQIQQVYDDNLVSGSRYNYLPEIQEFSKENGIEIEIKKDVLQKAYENVCTGDVEYIYLDKMADLEKIAEENGIEFDNVKELMEKTYIEAIHNVRLGHASGTREGLVEKLQKLDSDLTYEDVIKMDYLEDLKVPEEQRLNMEKTVEIGDAPITARFYGQKQETPVQGKFIIGITPENTLEFVSDSTLGEHRDIAGKYDLEIIGGGWLEIDEPNKKVKIYNKSQDFGYEPRSISKKVVTDSFPGYEIEVED